MVLMELFYTGDKRCELSHMQSGTKLNTDAPLDNGGKGQSFSPTDMMTASLAACMTTILANKLEPRGIDLKGTSAKIVKHMLAEPRRIGQIDIDLTMGKGVPSSLEKEIFEICRGCPVNLSISPEIQVNLKIHWS